MEKRKPEPSPRPWGMGILYLKNSPGTIHIKILDCKGADVAEIGICAEESRERYNAELIVKAVNSYDKLNEQVSRFKKLVQTMILCGRFPLDKLQGLKDEAFILLEEEKNNVEEEA